MCKYKGTQYYIILTSKEMRMIIESPLEEFDRSIASIGTPASKEFHLELSL